MFNEVSSQPSYVQVTNPNYSMIKLNLTHSVLNIKVQEVRFDLFQNISDIKKICEKKFGTSSESMSLMLQDTNGNNLCVMGEDDRNLGYYTPQENYIIHVIDLDPNSITLDLEDTSKVQKYKISEEDYDKLPDNFRKFKQKYIDNANSQQQTESQKKDVAFMFEEASKLQVEARCQLKENGFRGTIKYIGTISELGEGWWCGVKLDEPVGKNNGSVGGTKYFDCGPKYGVFCRPDKVEMGDFPEEDLDEI